tara:strand:- start:4315 stop:4713 length:399 start_codon:yes stop_codon:yes gene_type:complete
MLRNSARDVDFCRKHAQAYAAAYDDVTEDDRVAYGHHYVNLIEFEEPQFWPDHSRVFLPWLAQRRECQRHGFTGREVIKLMRKHDCTIRDLAKRMSITIKRIREVRRDGLACPLSARDWLEAITGTDPGRLN